MRILFVSSEGLPFSKTGGLADVVEALPKALASMGHEVAVFLPRYRGNKAARTVVSSLSVPLGGSLRFPAVSDAGSIDSVRYFLLDDPEFFDRDQLYGDRSGDFPDNPKRFAELSRAAIEFSKQVWMPHVFHCHDWQTALLPVYLRTLYATDQTFDNVAVVFTIHNLAYQGVFPPAVLSQVGVPESLFRMELLEYYGKANFLKGGLLLADCLTTVSRKYSQEILTPGYGCGLEGVLRLRQDRLAGILNGVDYSAWSPESDTFIAAHYSAEKIEGKRVCKRDLLETFHLPSDNLRRPLVGIVSRFVDQKGFDLISKAAEEVLKEDLTLIALGTGAPQYEQLFRKLAEREPSKVGVRIAYDNALAHKIEAGADIFLMPSRYEPCGLNQIYSLRYGTVPVVRATGGLDDTVEPFNPKTGKGTGFKFEACDSRAMLDCLRQALVTYRDAHAWRAVQANGMAKDFSWKDSAATYVLVYEQARRWRILPAFATSNQ